MTRNSGTATDVEMLETMLVEDLAQLPVDTLIDLQESVHQESELARTHARVLAAALACRYAEREQEARRVDAKPTGRIRFEDEGFVVVAEAAKQVHWDRDKLAAALDKLPVDISETYAKWTLVIEERRYAEAPAPLRAVLEPARTVAVGKSTYHLEHKTEGVA